MNHTPVDARVILGLAVPALASLLAEPLMGLLDTALLGRVGSTELAALGAANALLGVLAASLVFLEYGTTARLARRFGAGQLSALAREAIQMGWLALLLGIVLTVVLAFFPRPLLRLLDLPPEVLDAGATYLSIRALGSIPGLWIRVGNGAYRGLQDTRTPLWIVVAMNVLNAVLDIVLIFGWPAAGIAAFGIEGAAWATTVATWMGAATFLVLLARRLRPALANQPVTLRASLRLDPRVLGEMLALSRDLLLRSYGLQAALFMGTRMAAGLGTTSLAAHQVAWQIWLGLALLLDSLAIAGQALVGRLLGGHDPGQARAVGNRLCRWGFVLGLAFCGVVWIAQGAMARLFTADPEVVRSVESILWLLALMQIPNAVLFVIDGLLIGAGDFRFLRNAMIALGVFGAATAWAGGTYFGSLRGVWLGVSVFMLARTWVMVHRWRGRGWIAPL